MPARTLKILIIAPSWIGDMVMAQALFKTIKANNPKAVIEVLSLAWTQPLLERMPEVDNAIVMPIGHAVWGWKMRTKLGKELRKQQYAQAIVLPNTWKSALIPWFANIPVRTGWRGEMRYGLLNDLRTLDKSSLPMMVQRYVALAYDRSQAHIAPNYPTPTIISQPVSAKFQLPLSSQQKRLIFCPGAEFGPAKQWPATHYAELANTLIQQNWQLLILGSPADKTIATTIFEQIAPANQSSAFNLSGTTQLSDAIDLLATADLVISNDSGLMHIASALQKPLIAIYGASSPNFTPPLAKNVQIAKIKVDCGPCLQKVCPKRHHRCLQELSSAQIMRHFTKLNQL